MKNLGLLLAVGVGAFLLFRPKSSQDPNEPIIQQWMNIMRNSPEWFASIVQKADQNNISVAQQLRLDAIWAIEQGWQLP